VVDLSAYEQAPIIEDPDVRCEWCGETGNVDQGGVRGFNNSDKMHAGCKWSNDHGALRTQLDGDL
jgi:hypothetical protein